MNGTSLWVSFVSIWLVRERIFKDYVDMIGLINLTEL